MASKYAPALPHAAIGAALGAAGGYAESQMSNEPLRQRIGELEAKPDRSAKDTANLAQLHVRHTYGEFANKHPVANTAIGALGGGMLGLKSGPAIVEQARQVPSDLSELGSNVKKMFRGAA